MDWTEIKSLPLSFFLQDSRPTCSFSWNLQLDQLPLGGFCVIGVEIKKLHTVTRLLQREDQSAAFLVLVIWFQSPKPSQ